MRKLTLLLVLALAGTLAVLPPPAVATTEPVEPPYPYLRGSLGIYTVKTHVRLRLDAGGVNMPDAVGEENRSWDVQVLRADMRAATRPAWRTALTRTTLQRHQFAVGSGRIICVRARQHSWGVTSRWSPLTCVVRAREDQHVRREGRTRVVDDLRYVDGRATKIYPRGRMLLRGVPAGAFYGPVITHRLNDANTCVTPSWRIRGRREPDGAFGVASGAVMVLFHRTRVAGTAVVSSPYGHSCPVGGFVVVPRWVPR